MRTELLLDARRRDVRRVELHATPAGVLMHRAVALPPGPAVTRSLDLATDG